MVHVAPVSSKPALLGCTDISLAFQAVLSQRQRSLIFPPGVQRGLDLGMITWVAFVPPEMQGCRKERVPEH